MTDSPKTEASPAADLQGVVEFQQRRFECLASLVDEVVFEMDQRGVMTYLNGRAYEISGYQPDDLREGFDATQLVVEEDRPRARDNLVKLMQGAEPEAHEYTARRKDGSTFPGITRSAVLRSQGQFRGVLGTIRDISARREAEKFAREREYRFQTVFQTIPDAIAVTTLDGVFVDVNEGFCAVTGYRREQVVGHSVFDLGLYSDFSDRERGREALLAAGALANFETVLIHSDGLRRDALMSARLFTWDGIPHLLTVGRDITENKRAEREQHELVERVQQAQRLESLGVLAGGIAHDFNNLLMGILGQADVGLADAEVGSPVAARLSQIQDVARRAAELTGQLLAYSGHGRFVTQPVDLSRLARELRPLFAMSVSKKAELCFELTEDLPAVHADPSQLQQVMMNLVLNASEALVEGSGRIGIRTGVAHRSGRELSAMPPHEARSDGHYVFVEVCDDGCGLADDVRDRMFEPFFSTKFTGRGLGLAALLGIVRSHGGAIETGRCVPQGTRIRVYLPASGARVPAPDPEPAVDTTWRGQGTVLLIDDDADVRMVGELMLRRLGFDVVLAEDGYQGCELLDQHRSEVRCVLLDLTMPGLDGVETLIRLRQVRADVPVVLSSGFTEQDAVERFAKVELAGFLQKPYGTAALREKLRRALGE
ncbi:MAG: PAS domain S-box protein [Pseudomonadota bacterium]